MNKVMAKINPFIMNGYRSEEYFCDRIEETAFLTRQITNGNNVALISPRRLGKTGLIEHCFHQKKIKNDYYTFLIDIYATKNLQEFVFEFGKSILNGLKSQGKRIWEIFLNTLSSLRTGITFDEMGHPSWNLKMGDIKNPSVTLDEIFKYLEKANKPCLVAIDEFQVIAKYPEKNIEATLRTYIQHCTNAYFIYAGSQRHMMGEIFTSPSRPFYQSTTILDLQPIKLEEYTAFIKRHFHENNKDISEDTISQAYRLFEGTTWYIQFLMNFLYADTSEQETCTADKISISLNAILSQMSFTYSSLLFQLPPKQKEVLIAICKEGKIKEITSSKFLHTYKLTASSVQGALKGLLEKDFVTVELGTYRLYDRFFELWLKQNF
jgi:AAA+ ATPase superfamily predicted ATPase